MLAFACALFVGVSCTNEGTDDGGTTTPPTSEPTYDVVLTVGELAEPFAANGGTATLSVTLSKDVIGANVVAETSATWLEVSVTEENEVALTASAFDAVAAPRTAEVTVSYVNESNENLAAPVTATVSQASPEATFTVEWSNQTQMGATATITAADAEMVFGAFTFGESKLEVSDDPMPWSTRADAAKKSPVDYAKEQLVLFADPMGYGGLGIGFYYMAQSMSGLLSNMNGNVLNCSLLSMRGGAEKKMYLVVVGLNWGLNMDTYEDTTTQKGMVHVFEVENLPQPAVNIAKESVTASYAEDCVVVDYNVENPTEDGVLTAESDSEWLDATASSTGKLHLFCKENPYAKSRSANVTVTYTYKCMVSQWGETMEMPITATATVKVEQEANPNVKPLTFTIKVKDTHYDRIVADIVPSDANACYCVGAESQSNYNNYTQWYANAWDALCNYALGTPCQGTLTDYVFEINTQYAADPEDWTYYVFAFATDAEGTVVAGEPTYKETQVTNDTPTVTFDLDYEVASGLKITYNEETGNYELNTPAEGGTFTVKYAFANAPEGAVLRINNMASDVVSDTNDVLGGDPDATPVFDDANNTMTVVVNPYDASKTAWYQHYVTIYVRMYTSADKTQSIGKAIQLKINQTAPAAAEPAK